MWNYADFEWYSGFMGRGYRHHRQWRRGMLLGKEAHQFLFGGRTRRNVTQNFTSYDGKKINNAKGWHNRARRASNSNKLGGRLYARKMR